MEGVPHIGPPCVNFRVAPPRELAIAQLADRQHGVVSLTQLRTLGLSKSAVSKRAATGRLHRIHRGVYAVGHPRLTASGHRMAAVLACGAHAALSHRSAGAHRGFRPDNRAVADVSLPRRTARSRPGIHVHVSATLTRDDVDVHDGIPCTSVARTLVDLADVLDRRGVERVFEAAERLRVFDLRAVEAVLGRSNGRPGAAVVRTVLAELGQPAITANDLEERFLAICRAASLPGPEVNVWLAIDDGPPIKVDFLWRKAKLVVETDGFESHGTRQAFERDRLRDQRLRLAGYHPVRFTWRQIVYDAARVGATVAALYARPAR